MSLQKESFLTFSRYKPKEKRDFGSYSFSFNDGVSLKKPVSPCQLCSLGLHLSQVSVAA